MTQQQFTRDEEASVVDAAADGAYAFAYTQGKAPRHYDANQRWAWDLGWRLQEFLAQERAGE